MRKFVLLLGILHLSIVSAIAQCYCEDCPEGIIWNSPSSATLNVSGAINNELGQNGQSLINVGVTFSHDAAQELSLRLVAPNGSFVDLTIGEGLDFGQNNNFDINFIPCSGAPDPDCTNNTTWTSTDEWDGGPYTGSYFPEFGCLEDLTGDMNGQWTLELEDVFVAEDGELFCFDLTFADTDGISCNTSGCGISPCLAQGGDNVIPFEVNAPEGDPSLIIDFSITYEECEFPPPSPEYLIVYIIYEPAPFPGTIVEIQQGTVDMTGYEEGIYTVQPISILASDLPALLAIDFNTESIFDVLNLLVSGVLCGDNTVSGAIITIEETCDLVLEATLEIENITAPQNDPSLDPDWLITYISPQPDPAEFGFYYVVVNADTDVLVAYYTTDDFTLLLDGNYYVTVVYYDLDDLQLLPPPNGINTFSDLVNLINNETICADYFGFNELVILPGCDADSGTFSDTNLTECEGSNDLILSIDPDYPVSGPDPSEYGYTYVVSENGIVIAIDPSQDFTSYAVGVYEICGLSYLLSDEPLIPNPNGILTSSDIITDISNDLYCADLTVNCITLTISEEPNPIFTGPTTVCPGENVQYVVENFTGNNLDYLFTINQGGFEQFINDEQGTLDVIWSSGPGNICVTQILDGCEGQTCLTIDVVPQPTVSVDGPEIVCPGEISTYTFTPQPQGNQFFDFTITNGTVVTQTNNTVTIEWGSDAFGNISVALLGGNCDSEYFQFGVLISNGADFPQISIPETSCLNSGLAIPDINDPGITNWDWTATNATIIIDNGFVNFTWESLGLSEICLEITTACDIEEMCFDVNILPFPEPTIDPNYEFCTLNFTLDATPSFGDSWLWTSPGSGNSVSYSNQTNFSTDVTVTGPGVYTFVLQEFGTSCSGNVETVVTVVDGLTNGPPSFICDIDGNYIVSYTITSGTGPYTVDGSLITGNVFSSTNIPSGDSYSFLIEDSEGCSVTLMGDYMCPCISDGGTMDQTPIQLCVSADDNAVGIFNDDATFDSDDIGVFVLHTGNAQGLGAIIAVNNTGVFSFDPNLMIPGVSYYISYVVGNDIGGVVDFVDPCLSVAVGQQVIFFDDPFVDAGADDATCNSSYNLSGNAITTGGSWTIESAPLGSNVEIQIISGQSFVEFDQPGTYVFTLSIEENGCIGMDEVTIIFNESPTSTNLLVVCDGENYTVSFDIENGEAPYLVNGDLVSGSTFSSTPISSGETYGFTIVDVNGCSSNFIQGTKLCNCESDAGTMSEDPISVCAVEGDSIVSIFNNDAVFGSNDGGIFVLHTGSANILGNLIDQNDNGVFVYNSSYGVDTTLYISFVVADVSGTSIDFDDECLAVSIGQPVFIDSIVVVDAGEYSNQCDYTIGLNADDAGVAGEWNIISSPPTANVVFENIEDAQTVFETDLPGAYSISWIPTGSSCAIADTANFILDSLLQLDFKLALCNDNLESYLINAQVSGGVGPYFLDGVEITANFTTAATPSGESYSYIITDGRGCELLIEGTVTCGCTNFVGTMATDTLNECINDTIYATYNGDGILDGNDGELFVLHTSSSDTLGEILAITEEPTVVFDENLNIGTVYYLSHIIGNENGGSIDLTDPCLKVSLGQPIVFRALPSVNVGLDQMVCGFNAQLNGLIGESDYMWSIGTQPLGGGASGSFDQLDAEVEVLLPGDYVFVLSVDNGICDASDSLTISFVDPLEVIDQQQNCQEGGYTVSFILEGGQEPYSVNGAELPGNDFESDLIPTGDSFIFTIADNGICDEIVISGNDDCGCTNDAGTMNADYLILCEDEVLSISELTMGDYVTDSDDELFLVIHSSSDDELGAILGIYGFNDFADVGFEDLAFVTGTTYYLSLVLANAGALEGTEEDPCLKVANGTPFEWKRNTTIAFEEDRTGCKDELVAIVITAQGELPFEVVISDNLGNSEAITIDEENFIYEFLLVETTSFTLSPAVNSRCFMFLDDLIRVEVEEIEEASIVSGATVCNSSEFGSTIDLNDQITSGNVDGSWFFDGDAISGIIDFENFGAGQYQLFYTISSIECDEEITYPYLVEVEECDCITFEINELDVSCFGRSDGAIEIMPSGNGEISNYTISLDDTPFEEFIVEDLQAGFYTITIGNGEECLDSFEVEIAEPRAVQISLGEDMEANINDPILIEAITNLIDEEIQNITWESLQGILENSELFLNTSFQNDDQISITIIDENGCSASDDIMVRVVKSEFFLPNIINPNSGSGNDKFGIQNSESIDEVISFFVYDRWGNVMFDGQSINPSNKEISWDGTFNGQNVSPGVYVYKIQLRIGNETETIFGDLTVIR